MATPIVADTPERGLAMRQLASDISMLKYRCHAIGLTLTAHALERPMQIVGFEIAAQENGTWPDDVTKAMEKAIPNPEKARQRNTLVEEYDDYNPLGT